MSMVKAVYRQVTFMVKTTAPCSIYFAWYNDNDHVADFIESEELVEANQGAFYTFDVKAEKMNVWTRCPGSETVGFYISEYQTT